MSSVETMKKYLSKVGIEPEATDVYTQLFKLGPSSALQLSKATKLSRTQTYRRLEELQAVGLVSAEQLSYGTLFRALPLDNIEGLIANREAENAALRRNLSGMSAALQALAGSAGPTAQVQHYYGLAGLKQVNWNLTKADKEYRVFEVAHLSRHLDKAFARRCRDRYVERGLTSYDLTNAEAVTAEELEPFNPAKTFLRHVDPAILTINFEVYLYNQVVTLVDYSQENAHALEINHPALHTMMKQLFEAIWQQATPLEIMR